MKTYEKVFFLIALVVSFIGIIHLIPTIATIGLTVAIIIYLFAGWLLLSPDASNSKIKWMPFLTSYLIAQSFLTVLFGIKEWPMQNLLSYVTMLMLIIGIGLILVFRQKLQEKYPINAYLIRLILCFMFSGSPLWI